MKLKRTPWTEDEVRECEEIHDARMAELDYPPELQRELRLTRCKWLEKVPRVRAVTETGNNK